MLSKLGFPKWNSNAKVEVYDLPYLLICILPRNPLNSIDFLEWGHQKNGILLAIFLKIL